jgi:hypothetical protein
MHGIGCLPSRLTFACSLFKFSTETLNKNDRYSSLPSYSLAWGLRHP